MKLDTIITTEMLTNNPSATDGYYDLKDHGNSFYYDNLKYNYLASGLARRVFKSECGTFVIKIPIADKISDVAIKDIFNECDVLSKLQYKFERNIRHNIGEALAYKDCPDEYRTYFAETELLSNGWVKQEFVHVIKTHFYGMQTMREMGMRKDRSICIFDYDEVLDNFVYDGCNWERIKTFIEEIKLIIPNTKYNV